VEDRGLETFLTLILADAAPELARAHDELYPERVPEAIPLSLTLLYPFATQENVEAYVPEVRSFFASRKPFAFELTHVAQWEGGGAVYGVPEPDEELRATMRALWERFAEFPPYGKPGNDPPPHASLTLDGGPDPAVTLARVEDRLAGLLPARFQIDEVALMEEYEPDRCRIRETFAFG
jgi:hypothetical protein